MLVASCAHDRSKPMLGPRPALPEQKRTARVTPPPEWYWEPVEANVREGGAPRIDRPTSEAALVRLEGATRVWDELGGDRRERLRNDGVVALAPQERPPREMGVFYMNARDERVPYVISLDALFYATRIAVMRAVAEVEDVRIAPALDSLLVNLSTRLGAEQRGAGVEVGEGLRVARGLVGVAAALANRKTKIDADIAPVVSQELARIDAHAGVEKSALLGVPIDYTSFRPPPETAHPAAFKALAWLGAAPLSLVGMSEAQGAMLEIGTVRTQARAAMLLARLVDRDIDPRNADAYARIAKLLAFVWGTSDDVALTEIADVASQYGVTLANADDVANVAKVDRLRKRAAQSRTPLVYDGSGAPGRGGASVRMFGGSAPPDSAALARLVGPVIGPGKDAAQRVLPSTLDLAAWLGAKEARAALRESRADSYEGYDAALARLVAERPTDDALHGSLHGSFLAAIAAWITTSGTPTEQRATIESALAAWTWMRHDGVALTRRGRDRPRRQEPGELRIAGAPLAAFVEPAPEAIARLIGLVKQAQKGLAILGALDSGSPALTDLADVEDLLRGALRIAEHEVNDEALDAADAVALAAMPARLASLETDALPVTCAAMIHSDLHGHTLTSATGFVEPLARVVREPGSGRLVLAVGAHVAHHELAERITDAALEKRLVGSDKTLTRGAYVAAFHAGTR
jgi:hypothetical protein